MHAARGGAEVVAEPTPGEPKTPEGKGAGTLNPCYKHFIAGRL